MARTFVTDFVSIDPSPEWAVKLRAYKDDVRQLVGDQAYLDDPPHISAYLARFAEGIEIDETIAEVAANFSPIAIELDGWHVLEADPWTGERTLTIHVSESSCQQLHDLQSQIIAAISDQRDREATQQHYNNVLANFSPLQRESIEKIGFPFCGDAWEPQFVIASIRKPDWKRVADSLLHQPPTGQAVCSSVTHYRIIDGETYPLQRYDLR
ncbi:2'-5' RNA ligase family protein [Blastopirellula sp. JC732]|uniref:2'-5' RNA ligase family protein n=1 Tax=Blastopirellula sediminis TaxID=2894196 RepID=A0A9X1SKY3_9BACT|nr:2'-5' RNA ligase family protein [Blastopirellula sediminis]MCC9606463.1 2'-5' RNA ligase family protein [Blastopirellula sediminis]MCC9630239.1 2'-5' RNA ligase family protein [Blastopirellula sediminis]